MWESKALLFEWLLTPGKTKTRLHRILAQLALAESREPDPHFQTDYRIGWIAIYTADVKREFDCGWDAFVSASYRVLGLHPDKVWSAMVRNREAWLGPGYPKKPLQSVRIQPRRKKAA